MFLLLQLHQVGRLLSPAGQNSSVKGNGLGRFLYQDPDNQIMDIEVTTYPSKVLDFIYHKDSNGGNALVPDANILIVTLLIHLGLGGIAFIGCSTYRLVRAMSLNIDLRTRTIRCTPLGLFTLDDETYI